MERGIKTLRLLRLEEELAERFTIYPIDGNCAYAPTKEYFLTFTSNGINYDEDIRYGSDIEAVDKFINVVMKYCEHKRGILYWRVRPLLYSEGGLYIVYSRFLISDEPIDMNVVKKYYGGLDEQDKS